MINGQKVWTTGAHYSDFGIVLVRTNPDVPKHKGLTMFWLDMKSPGIEVRPIHQMSGGSTSTRSISPTCGSRTPSGWARSTTAGGSRWSP